MNFNNMVIVDTECYINYWLIMFKKVSDGKYIHFDMFNGSELNRKNILHIINKYTIVTFNGIKYDSVMIEAACQGFNNATLKNINDTLIGIGDEKGLQPWQVRKQFGIGKFQLDHIDLIEPAPLRATLKIYGGRLHAPKMQDLPIEPEDIILKSDVEPMRLYCRNDLDNTEMMLRQLDSELDLRQTMSEEYNVDLLSKSDAQIAEEVIKSEMQSKYDITPKRNKIKSGTIYRFISPNNISFKTDILKDIHRQYCELPITVNKSGHVDFNFEIGEEDRIKTGKRKGELPEAKSKLKFLIGDTKYTIGIGGIHSNEKKARHTNEEGILREYDVASYYPNIILNNSLFPKHLGIPFLEVYRSIVARRLKAKLDGNKVVNESLKITINGSFGKFASKWSFLYSPDLMMQVTITGQLTLLMLIERLELAGIKVVSGNTDGIVVKTNKNNEKLIADIIDEWEFDTNYSMGMTDYKSLNSRDVNNYIAIKESSIKGKGAYADQNNHFYKLRSNPVNIISIESVKKFLSDGTPVEETINNCYDVTKFITVRTVNGGALKGDKLLGKAIRWYYGAYELDAIHYKTSGNKVPRSDGGVPLMDLPDTLPEDIDYNWYIEEAKTILKNIGYK